MTMILGSWCPPGVVQGGELAGTAGSTAHDGDGWGDPLLAAASPPVLPGRPALAVDVDVAAPEAPGAEPRFLILRRFEFSSERARNGVLAQHPSGRRVFYAKGAPEVIRGLVEPSSIPETFDEARMTGLLLAWVSLLARLF